MRQSTRREDRISMDIVVDAYTSEERAMGWYYYLEGKLRFPFRARCIKERAVSPFRKGEEVEVLRMAPEDACLHEMFVIAHWAKRRIAVPLAQLEPATVVDQETQEAIADWHYWMRRGYQL
jgi:hypothetical protein